MNILIIEDSERLRHSLVSGFKRLDFFVDSTTDGKVGLNYALNNDYDVIILDLMLPSMDGLSILKALRNCRREVEVLILSAKDKIESRVEGLNLGADDYMIKPFSFDELHARVLTLTRRKHKIKSPLIHIDEVTVNTLLRNVEVKGEIVPLTRIEYLIVEYLSLNANRVITYDSLIDTLYSNEATATRNNLEAHVCATRRKLKKVFVDDLIKTKRGFGYYIEN